MARSDYLKRCRELADVKPIHDDICPANDNGVCNCPAAAFEKTVHTSPAYHKLLGHAERLEDEQIPEELFDGYSVLENLNIEAQRRTGAAQVADVLDSIVRLIKQRLASGE